MRKRTPIILVAIDIALNCQGLNKLHWIEQRKEELLPIEYFHVVFTIPHQLYGLLQGNEKTLYNILFQTCNETLQSMAERRWNASLGLTAILHTWGQKINQHIHLHCIVTGGALTHDGKRFIRCPKNYLFPAKAMQKVYAGKFLANLIAAYQKDEFRFSLGIADRDAYFYTLIKSLNRQDWIVYLKKPFAGPEEVVHYLGCYTHKIAISNHRIEEISQDQIVFRYKDYRDQGKIKSCSITAEVFIKRFLQHVLPPRFVRIRHFGLLASGYRKQKLNRARELFELAPVSSSPREGFAVLMAKYFRIDIHKCPHCKQGYFHRKAEIQFAHAPPRKRRLY